MEFKITTAELISEISEIISRAAGRSYSTEGDALYDGLRLVSRDSNTLNGFITESLATIKSMCHRFLDYEAEETDGELAVIMALTERRRRGKADIIEPLLRNALAQMVVSKYFIEKDQTELAQKHDSQASADLLMVQHNLYEKSAPRYPKGSTPDVPTPDDDSEVFYVKK